MDKPKVITEVSPDDFESARSIMEELIKKLYGNLEVPESMIPVQPTAQSQSQIYGQGGLHRIYGGARSCGKRLQSLHNNPSFICEVDSVESEENDNNEHIFDSFRSGVFNTVTFDSFDAIYNASVIPDNILITPQGITIPNEEDQKTINKRNKKNMQDFVRNKYDDRRIK